MSRQRNKISFPKVPTITSGPKRTALPGRLRKVHRVVGPGDPPSGFLNAWNSRTEWIVYWALWKILKEEGDVRRPPFVGGQRFSYQTVLEGGRHSLGGQVVDFVVRLRGGDIGILVETDRFHLTAGPRQNAIDRARILSAARYMTVRPVYEIDLISDPTGEQACRTLVATLGGKARMNPAGAGTYRPSRLGRLYGGR